MVFLGAFLVSIWVATTTVLASPLTDSTCPVVTLDKGTFIGTTANGTNRFLGIPFAHPPSVLDYRFGSPPSLTDPPNWQSRKSAFPSARATWPIRWLAQCYCVRSFVPPASEHYTSRSVRLTPGDARRLIDYAWDRSYSCRRRRL